MAKIQISLNGKIIGSHSLDVGRTYIFGRDKNSDVRMDGMNISRRHMSLESKDGLTWTAKRLSKTGKLLSGSENIDFFEMTGSHELQIPPYSLLLVDVGEVNNSSIAASSEIASPLDQRGFENSLGTQPVGLTTPDDLSDSTQIRVFAPRAAPTEMPHLLIENPMGEIVRLRLEGEQWIIGRDETVAQILIPDIKCSRRHLKLTMNRGEYFAEDLASTQGTELNHEPLRAHHIQRLYSGDVFAVGQYKITFELHDAKFENELRKISPDLLSPVLASDYETSEQIPEGAEHLPVFGDPTDYQVPVRPRKPIDYLKPAYLKALSPKYKAVAGAVLLAFLYVVSEESGDKVDVRSKTQMSQAQDPFERLTSEQKQYIISSYNLGDTFMKRRNYDAALREFQKIHELVPSYQKSRDYEEAARHAMEAVAQKVAMREELQKEIEIQRKVSDVLVDCEGKMASFHSQVALDQCLAPVNDLDPGNKQADALRGKFEDAEARRTQSRDAHEAALENIKRGENLFKRAETLKRRGQIQTAIETFRSVMNSDSSDSKRLKEQSRREIASLQSTLKSQTDQLIQDANGLISNNQLKEASLKLDRVLVMDPANDKAKNLRSKIKNDMKYRMKMIYGDSILLESLGSIDEAREKWKTIVKSDLPDGEYYLKAKAKISKYGER